MRGQYAAQRRGVACVWAWLLLPWLVLLSPRALAKPDPRSVAQVADSVATARASQLLKAAQSAIQQNALSLTYQLLEEAYRLRGDIETLYLLGHLAYIERRSIEAVDLFRRYAAEREGGLPEERSDVTRALHEPLPPSGEALILGEKGSLVLVDERLVGTLPLSAPLLLSAGKHQVVLELAARRKQQDLDIHSGSSWLLRSSVDSDDITLSQAPLLLWLPHYRGLDGGAIRQLEQAVDQSAHDSGHIVKKRDQALGIAPQLAGCLDSLLCQEELGRRSGAEYVLLLHSEHSGLGQQSDWRLHLSLIDVAVGDRAVSANPLCTSCTVVKAAATIGTTVAQMLEQAGQRPRGSLQISSVPSRAEVFVGDRKLGITPLKRPAWAGRVPIEVRSPGLPPYQGEILIEPERTVSLQVQLGDGTSDEDATQQKPTQRPLYKKWWLWAIGGVVVGGATLGLILGLTPRSHQSINWVQ